jgi:hypothetical protein
MIAKLTTMTEILCFTGQFALPGYLPLPGLNR